MNGPIVGIYGVVVLLILILMGLPVGFSFIITGFLGLLYLTGLESALHAIGSTAYVWASNYTFVSVPLFILMGVFAHESGISRDLYDACYKWVGRFRGGLAMATVLACGGFAALSGSSLATAAAMGTVALPEMKRVQYSRYLAVGTVAAGGTLGILIPPSIPLIIIGILTEESIAQLFIGGVLPGILELVLYCAVIYVTCTLDPKAGPPAPRFSLAVQLRSVIKVWPMLAIFLVIMLSIYLGVATPTEAAAFGTFGSFLFVLTRRRLTRETFISVLTTTGNTAAMLVTILIGAMIFSVFLSVTRLPMLAADWVGSLDLNKYLVLSIVLGLYIPLGCVMDSLAMIVLTIPLFFPTLKAIGFSPVLLAILAVRCIEIGMITPPVGMNVFIVRGIVTDVSIGQIFKGIIPFFVADLICVAVLVSVPQITLFLPSLMK